MRRGVIRMSVQGLVVAGPLSMLACDDTENPFYKPENVTMSLTVSSSGSACRAGDTVRYTVDVHLPHLVGEVTVTTGSGDDSGYVLPMSTDESVVDYVDSVSHVYTQPGNYKVCATTERDDGVVVTATDSIRVEGWSGVVRALYDTSQSNAGKFGEKASCSVLQKRTVLVLVIDHYLYVPTSLDHDYDHEHERQRLPAAINPRPRRCRTSSANHYQSRTCTPRARPAHCSRISAAGCG